MQAAQIHEPRSEPPPGVILEQHVIRHHDRRSTTRLQCPDDVLDESQLLVRGIGGDREVRAGRTPPPFFVPKGGLVRTRSAFPRFSPSGESVSNSDTPPSIPCSIRFIRQSRWAS